MFKYMITINPLGFMYGSAGGFLSPENLVGRSNTKFPPEAATLAGLFFSANKANSNYDPEELKKNHYIAGPFWANCDEPDYFYVPIPWNKIIAEKDEDEWSLKNKKWHRQKQDLDPDYRWQTINSWDNPPKVIRKNKSAASDPWRYIPHLHPEIKAEERHVKDGRLFLENSVQMSEDTCLVYLSTHQLPKGWYRFGGESHIVEINSIPMDDDHPFLTFLKQPIKQSFALITPGVWGSNRHSYRYPQHPDFPTPVQMLTDKSVPYRYRTSGRLGRGRYAVPAGSVYLLDQPLNKSWWDWQEEWFPKEGYSLKRVGCGLSLPLDINGLTP